MGESLLSRIAGVVGTPAYVYDAGVIRERYRLLDAAFTGIPHRVHYAVKANSSLAVLGVLRRLGAGVEIVSRGELERVRRAGFEPSDVAFGGVGKAPQELAQAVALGVGMVSVESRREMELLADAAAAQRTTVRCGIRVNPEVTTDTHPYTRTGDRGMKFGVPLDEVTELGRWAAAQRALELVGIGAHIGSQILDASRYGEAAEKLAQLVDDVRRAGVGTLEQVSMGGGFGIDYGGGAPLEPAAVAAAVRPLWEATGLTMVVEPGRSLVASGGVLLTRCLYRKHSGGRDFVVVDAGMNDLLRPSLYGAEHRITVVGGVAEGPGPKAANGCVDVVGPICESGDFLGLERPLGRSVTSGTLLMIHDTGAYGFTMSSTYNSRPRAPEILVDEGRWAVIRERECAEDLMRGERLLEEVGQWEG